MIAKLIARTGPLAGKDFTLPDTARIGAAKEAEVQIRLEGVSRNHARMYRDGEAYWLEDAGSTNGTFLNGQRIQRDRLRHLDVVTLGRNIDLIFLCKAGEAPAAAPREGVLGASFVWLDGPEANARIEVSRGEITIGRASSCNVVVESAAVSKVHARIIRSADQVTIQDLGSANGTFVNGQRVTSVMVLTDKDRVGLAGVRSFQMHIERDPAGAGAAADASAAASAPVFDQEWKTRLVWSPEEMQELEAMRQQLKQAAAAAPAAAEAKGAPAKPAPAKAPPPPPRAGEKPAAPGAAPAIKAPPAVPPRAAAAPGEAKGPPPVPPRAGAAGEAKGPPPVPPRAGAAGESKGPPPVPPRAAAPGDAKGPPPVPPRAGAAAGEAKGPPPVPPRAGAAGEAKGPPPVPPRNPPASPPGFPSAAKVAGSGASATSPAAPGAQSAVPRPDQTGAAEPRLPRVQAPASANADMAGQADMGMPAPHTSQPPPERRTGPHEPVLPATAPGEGRPIRAVRLSGTLGTFTLEAGTYTVGRGEKAEVRLDDREVSRAHAIVIVSPTSVSVEDQKSANGTFINGVEVTSRRVLRHGDTVMFGSLEFSVEIEH